MPTRSEIVLEIKRRANEALDAEYAKEVPLGARIATIMLTSIGHMLGLDPNANPETKPLDEVAGKLIELYTELDAYEALLVDLQRELAKLPPQSRINPSDQIRAFHAMRRLVRGFGPGKTDERPEEKVQ